MPVRDHATHLGLDTSSDLLVREDAFCMKEVIIKKFIQGSQGEMQGVIIEKFIQGSQMRNARGKH